MTEPVCPYCRMAFEGTGPAKIFCTACGTPHHEDCYAENGGCTVFGCSRAPADDPKLQVSQNDLQAVNLSGQTYVPAQPYVAGQRMPSAQYPPSMYGGPLGLSQGTAAAPAAISGQQAGTYPYANMAAPANAYVPPGVAFGYTSKNRATYIVLGIFLGALGVHNFYGGYTGRGVGQLCLTILTLGYLGIIAWMWAIVEICIVDKDGQGIPFK
ncbi:MAG TPA: NINE protein [Candidatus Sulfotelmatobacter sp.]|nr:NINE protein [Candidatus Sulfotelmatobacter sp.]